VRGKRAVREWGEVREAQKVRVEVRVKVRVRPSALTWINALYIGL